VIVRTTLEVGRWSSVGSFSVFCTISPSYACQLVDDERLKIFTFDAVPSLSPEWRRRCRASSSAAWCGRPVSTLLEIGCVSGRDSSSRRFAARERGGVADRCAVGAVNHRTAFVAAYSSEGDKKTELPLEIGEPRE
jgi:hypothetical protein